MGELSDSQLARFWSHVNKNSGHFYVDPNTGSTSECWEWESTRNKKGYGRFGVNGKLVFVHRISYRMHHGELGDLHALHKCDNPPCINPDHLYKGTNLENMRDRDRKGRRIPLRGDDHWTRRLPELVCRGERSGSAKLTSKKIKRIRELFRKGVKQSVLVKKYKVGYSQMGRIVHGTTWRHLL